MTIAQEKIRSGLHKLKQGLPMEAFAIVGDPNIRRPASCLTTPGSFSGRGQVGWT